ncbi:hypothetical protein [Methylococcus capsulatus]|uniref:hypothetical protein n=1 Tax=Methylococcus capsulatus TaxID=414 RepID=UPI001C527F09|nr:hypothetical protein [Methylococcus capsulatus]QXP88599.1 hypothetical protein KW112_05645 [Methylococcus capsulatus]QXP94387.1 hypothetical protein KW113_04085 [Methylococcus capsulatus]UQN10873.1 hypothetical protein M3M30_07370 [Methylococcus capsulatus]
MAEAFEHLEDRHPPSKDVATAGRVRETGLRLQKEIEEVEATLRLEIEKTRLEIHGVEVRSTQAIHRQTLWIIGAVGAVASLIRLLEWFLTHLPPP